MGFGDPLEKEMATHSSILAWEIPWTEEPDRLQFIESQRGRRDLVTKQQGVDSRNDSFDTLDMSTPIQSFQNNRNRDWKVG